jgi:hypothetical protein
MKIQCVYCHKPTKKSGYTVKMCCICDEDHRFLNIDEILSGFHHDKVYLLEKVEITNVYDQKNHLYTSLLDVG